MNETKDPAIDNWMKISRNVRSSCQLNCSIFKEPDADVPFFIDISWFVEFEEYFWGGGRPLLQRLLVLEIGVSKWR